MLLADIQQDVQTRIDSKLSQFIEQQTQDADELLSAM